MRFFSTLQFHRKLFIFSLATALTVVTGCSGPADQWGNSTVFGNSQSSTIYGQTDGQPIAVGDVEKAARIVGRLRKMNVSEQEILKKVAEKRFNFLVALEMETLRPKYEPKQKQIRTKARAQKEVLQSQVSQGKITPAVAQVKQQQVQVEEAKLLDALEVDWRQEARDLAQKNYGSNFGIAVASEQDKHVVAMAQVHGDTLEIATSLYTVNRPVVVVDSGAGGKILHDDKMVAVLSGPPVKLAGNGGQP